MSPKRKVVVAREHLTKARQEADGGDLRDAVQWSFAALEAAIDALAAPQGIAIDEQHWKRTSAAGELHVRGILPKDLSELHRELNHLRKGVFYAELWMSRLLADRERAARHQSIELAAITLPWSRAAARWGPRHWSSPAPPRAAGAPR